MKTTVQVLEAEIEFIRNELLGTKTQQILKEEAYIMFETIHNLSKTNNLMPENNQTSIITTNNNTTRIHSQENYVCNMSLHTAKYRATCCSPTSNSTLLTYTFKVPTRHCQTNIK